MSSKVPRLSASIVLLRRSKVDPKQFQVLLAQRSKSMNAFSSFYVFPGGVAEEFDTELARKLNDSSPRASLKITGIRELFEEAGVLLTATKDTAQAEAKAPPEKSWQKLIHENASEFEKLLNIMKAQPAINALKYWVSFITPVFEKRRFDNSFFLSLVEDADITIDGSETVHYTWLSPREALKQNKEGKIALLPPQFYVLSTIAEFQDVDLLMEYASKKEAEAPIQPHSIAFDDKKLTLAFPGDEHHPDYPGGKGDKRRIHCKQPMGRGGYEFEVNITKMPAPSKL